MVPNDDCYCEIDPETKDKWGIPVLRFHWKWSDYELNQARHMRDSFRAILETLGGTITTGRGGGGGRGDDGRCAGRHSASPMTRPHARRRRRHHPRSRLRAHGRQSEGQRRQQVLPGARSAQPVLCRRRSVRQPWRQESHAHDHRAGVAHRRVPGRRTEEEPMSEITRREALGTAGSSVRGRHSDRRLARAEAAHSGVQQATSASGGPTHRRRCPQTSFAR